LLLPLLSLVACGGGGSSDGVATREETTSPTPGSATPEPESESESVEDNRGASDLDGLTIRKVGLARFDVLRLTFEFNDFEELERDYTEAEAAFRALEEPLDSATLSRIAAMPGAGASGSCYPLGDEAAQSIGVLLESIGTPIDAGQALTVSRAVGSWFELEGRDDTGRGLFYTLRQDQFSGLGIGVEGHVEADTTMDIPGDQFPAFSAVEVPSVQALYDVVDDDTGVRWRAGADSEVPVVIDVKFADYVALQPVESDVNVSVFDIPIRTLVDAPADMRCVTRDTGRFAFPDALRATIDEFKSAGQAVADQVAAGSDLDTDAGPVIGPDGSLTDTDYIHVDQGMSVGVSRIATRYRIEGDALLIVQSSNGGTL